MNITERHQLILQKLQENGKVDIQELSDSPAGFRGYDPERPEAAGRKKLLYRTKGGGSTQNPLHDRTPDQRKGIY